MFLLPLFPCNTQVYETSLGSGVCCLTDGPLLCTFTLGLGVHFLAFAFLILSLYTPKSSDMLPAMLSSMRTALLCSCIFV